MRNENQFYRNLDIWLTSHLQKNPSQKERVNKLWSKRKELFESELSSRIVGQNMIQSMKEYKNLDKKDLDLLETLSEMEFPILREKLFPEKPIMYSPFFQRVGVAATLIAVLFSLSIENKISVKTELKTEQVKKYFQNFESLYSFLNTGISINEFISNLEKSGKLKKENNTLFIQKRTLDSLLTKEYSDDTYFVDFEYTLANLICPMSGEQVPIEINSNKNQYSITDTFGSTRKSKNNYGGKRINKHKGVDLASCSGWHKDINSSYDGIVTKKQYEIPGYGWYIEINHGEKSLQNIKTGKIIFGEVKTRYAHLNGKRIYVWKGKKVKKGDKIAKQGKSGAEDYHLHYELWINGKRVNPADYIPGLKPIN